MAEVTWAGFFVINKFSAVISHNCFIGSNTWQDGLSAAGKTCEKVSFDKAFGN